MADDPINETTAAPGTNAVAASDGGPLAPQPTAQAPLPAPPAPEVRSEGAATPQTGIGAEIAKILEDVKLPQRQGPVEAVPQRGQAPAFGSKTTFTPRQGQPAEHAVAQTILPPVDAAPAESPIYAPVQSAPEMPIARETQNPEAETVPAIQSLHTMKSDLQATVRKGKISIVRAASMEQDRRARQAPDTPVERTFGSSRRIGLILTAAALLLALGGAAIYATYTLMNATTASQNPAAPAILFTENQLSLPIDAAGAGAFKQALAGAFSGQGSAGSITQIIPVVAAAGTGAQKRPATLAEFFTALGANPPPDLMRALSENFFFGIHFADVPAPVFVIPVISYDRAFAGMLSWEESIDADLSALFNPVPSLAPSPGGGLPQRRQFSDLVMRNYDVRALKDDSGAIVLYYSFPTPEILIIAASPYTFPEVLSRLQAERKL